ncbi:MAG: hypothetical protein AB1717_03230 [Pseudomonadota bacterium]
MSSYANRGLLFYQNFHESAGKPGLEAYRGELIILEGEVGDAQGRRMPPKAVIKQAALLTDEKQILLLSGFLEDLANLPLLLDMYSSDFSDKSVVLLFVRNLGEPVQTTVNGARIVLLPLVEGMAWNEMLDELHLEKSDFKGQSAGEKVMTAYEATSSYAPKYPSVSLEEIPALTIEVRFEARGAI